MPKPKVDINIDALFEEANQNSMVRARVKDRTARIAARARRIDRSENAGRATITVEHEVLPNGRFVGAVQTDDVSGEYGDSRTARRRTLRRAAGGR